MSSSSDEARVMDIEPKYLLEISQYKINVSFIGYQDGQDLKKFALGGTANSW